jgi:hypothetical protein
MPIDRGYSGSDHPPDDEAQRPRDNRPLDFTRPPYRPRHDLLNPKELYKELFGESDDDRGSDEPTTARDTTDEPAPGRPKHAEERATPGWPATALDATTQSAEQLDTKARLDDQTDRSERPEHQDRPTAATVPTEAEVRPGQQNLGRPDDSPKTQDLGKGARGWWEVDPAETYDRDSADRSASQHVAETGEHRPDQPAESQEVAKQAPAAPAHVSQSRPSERIEQSDPPQPDRPQTLEERKAAYWAERGGETRHFPGWSRPEEGSSESPSRDQPAEPRASFVWGKVVYHDRNDEPPESRNKDAKSLSERPDAAVPAEGVETQADEAGGWDRRENPYSPLGGTRAAFNPEHTPEEQQAAGVEGVARTTDVLGRKPINASYAGRVFYDSWTDELKTAYPDGVQFSYEAFPEFARYATAIVQLDEGFGPTRRADEGRARHAWHDQTGEVLDEAGHTWHHHEDGRTLLLVPTDVHDATRHHGGWAISQRLGTRRTDDA